MAANEPNGPESLNHHQRIRKNYDVQSGRHKDFGINPKKVSEAQERAHTLITSGILPEPTPHSKYIIFSPSANQGAAEHILQERLGEGYKVIAGDLSNAIRLSAVRNRLQGNAQHIPFADATVTVIYDIKGGLQYDCITDEKRSTTEQSSLLLVEYQRILPEDGLLVLDDWDSAFSDGLTSTGERLDHLYGNNAVLKGFSPPMHIGEGLSRMRVYKKTAILQ